MYRVIDHNGSVERGSCSHFPLLWPHIPSVCRLSESAFQMNSKVQSFILRTSTPGTVSGCASRTSTPRRTQCPLFEITIFIGRMPRRMCRNIEVSKISCSTLVIGCLYLAGNPYVSCLGNLEGDNNFVEVNETEFSVTCGCLTTPAPTLPSAPTSVTDDDGDISGGSTCDETESFEITKAFAPNLEG